MDYKNVSSILKEYNHFIFEEDWGKSTKDHPDFPQLNAFADIFNQFAIDNYIAQVPHDYFDELPSTFIGLVSQNESIETAIIKKINNDEVMLIYFDNSTILNKTNFLNVWNGYILVIEENEKQLNISKVFSIRSTTRPTRPIEANRTSTILALQYYRFAKRISIIEKPLSGTTRPV